MRLMRALTATFCAAAAVALAGFAEAQPAPKKGETVKTSTAVDPAYSKDRKEFVVTATGQVPSGGWSGTKLTRRETKMAPTDGYYEYDLTSVRPGGIATTVISDVKATDRWKNPPPDIKGVKVYGTGDSVKKWPIK
jgi:hypothetical protein